MADLAPGGDARGPVHDHRVGHAALVHLPLPAAERGVPGDRPAPRVVVVEVGTSDVVDAAQRLLDVAGQPVPRAHVADGADRPTLGAGPVVGHDDDDRVLEVPGLGQVVDDAAHLGVGVREVAGEGLHVAGVQPPLVGGERRPRRHPLGALRQHGVLGQEAEGLLPLQRGLPPDVPPLVEAAGVAVDPLAGGLVGRMARPAGEPGEERLVLVDGPQVADPGDGVVGQVLGEVVALVGRAGLLGQVVVLDQGRPELVGLPLEEAVEALEAPAQRPPGPGGAGVELVLRREVPLPDGPRGVAGGGQRFGQQAARVRDAGVVAGEAARQLHDAAHADRVVVPPGEQAGPGGRAQRRGVEVGVAQTARGEPRRRSACRGRSRSTRAARSRRRPARPPARWATPRPPATAPATTASTRGGSDRSSPGTPRAPWPHRDTFPQGGRRVG